jgi:hypothetical protein
MIGTDNESVHSYSNGSNTYTHKGSYALKARFKLETEVMKVLTNEEIKFTKSMVFGETYTYSFRYNAPEGKFMKLDYGGEFVFVTQKFPA